MSFSPSAGALSNVIVDNENSLLVFFSHSTWVFVILGTSIFSAVIVVKLISSVPLRRHLQPRYEDMGPERQTSHSSTGLLVLVWNDSLHSYPLVHSS